MHGRTLLFALLASASLVACQRGADSGATASGSAPASSGGNAVVGTTGKGSSGGSTSEASRPPGVGLNGGLGTGESTKASGAGPAASAAAASQGSTNLTRKSSVGNR